MGTTAAIVAADNLLHRHEQEAAVVAREANAVVRSTPAPLKNGARAAKKAVDRVHWPQRSRNASRDRPISDLGALRHPCTFMLSASTLMSLVSRDSCA